MNSRKRIKGLDFDDDNDDSDKPKSPSYNIPSLSRKLEDSPHFNVHGYEHSTKDLPEESTVTVLYRHSGEQRRGHGS